MKQMNKDMRISMLAEELTDVEKAAEYWYEEYKKEVNKLAKIKTILSKVNAEIHSSIRKKDLLIGREDKAQKGDKEEAEEGNDGVLR